VQVLHELPKLLPLLAVVVLVFAPGFAVIPFRILASSSKKRPDDGRLCIEESYASHYFWQSLVKFGKADASVSVHIHSVKELIPGGLLLFRSAKPKFALHAIHLCSAERYPSCSTSGTSVGYILSLVPSLIRLVNCVPAIDTVHP